MQKLSFLHLRVRQLSDLYLSASNPTSEWKAVILAEIYHLAYDYLRLGGKRDLEIILRRLDK